MPSPLRLLALVSGLLLVIVGLWMVGAYVVGVINVLGEADRSWIFWGLALVAIGVPAITTGTALVVWGRSAGGPPGP